MFPWASTLSTHIDLDWHFTKYTFSNIISSKYNCVQFTLCCSHLPYCQNKSAANDQNHCDWWIFFLWKTLTRNLLRMHGFESIIFLPTPYFCYIYCTVLLSNIKFWLRYLSLTLIVLDSCTYKIPPIYSLHQRGMSPSRSFVKTPQCTSPISHNAPFYSRNVHVCTFLL